MKILAVHDFYQRLGGEDVVALGDKELFETHSDEVVFYTRHNNEIAAYGWTRKLFSPFDAIYSFHTRRDMQRIVRRTSPDVAYIHNFFPLVSPSVYHTLKSLNIPTVQVAHDFRLFCPNGWFYTRGRICERCKGGNYLHAVRYRCYRQSYLASLAGSAVLGMNRVGGVLEKISAFRCPTEFSKKKLLEAGIPESKLFVCPHSIDVSGIEPRFEPGSYILYLGRLSQEKGLLTLIRAVTGLRKTMLKIAGAGPFEHELRSYVQKEGLTNIEFVGHKSGQEKWDLVRNSLFVVVPSESYETFCMVVIESYAAGKPVIASQVGSLPYVLENGKSGLLFRSGSVDDLREKINYLCCHPAELEAMGRYGRELAETKYHPEETYRALMCIFAKVIAAERTGDIAANRSCTAPSSSVE